MAREFGTLISRALASSEFTGFFQRGLDRSEWQQQSERHIIAFQSRHLGFVKIVFERIIWAPLLPSTTCVMCRSAATLASM